ncbi:MAG TPA: hypothetical protein VFD71_02580, partial [Planctomycetota bacterium]|nr:hypothetical protein [Planctomycetota bacterium]
MDVDDAPARGSTENITDHPPEPKLLEVSDTEISAEISDGGAGHADAASLQRWSPGMPDSDPPAVHGQR